MTRWLTADKAFPAKGKGLCRVCGVSLSDGRYTTCSQACGDRVNLSTSATSQRSAVHLRDRGICARCGCDTEKLKRILRHVRWHARDVATDLGIPWGRRCGDLWDMAHIMAVCKGGGIVPGMTVAQIMGNLETLCLWCHREDTRALKHREERAMTELTTAKRWIADLRKRERPPEGTNLVGWVTESEIAEVQRNALEAAAKAVCWNCRQGYAVDRSTSTVWRHTIGALSVPCEATEIYDIIPENPAPTIEHHRGGIVITRDKTPSGNDVTYITTENPAPTAGKDEEGGGAQCKPA